MFEIIIYLSIGFILLYAGGELLINGGVKFSDALEIDPIVVGLTFVAFGTSAPELFVNVKAALLGSGGITMGNIIGSNIFNISFILGLSVIIRPIIVNKFFLRRDLPYMIGASILCSLLYLIDHKLDRIDAVILTAGLAFFIGYNIKYAKIEEQEIKNEIISEVKRFTTKSKKTEAIIGLIFMVLGCVALYYGSEFFVKGSILLAQTLGMSEALIGLTVVAVGTSLPELAATIIAALKKENDMAYGNIVGSNIFNIFGILGISSLIAPVSNAGITLLDFAVMLSVSVMLYLFSLAKEKLTRLVGIVFFSLYVIYTIYIIYAEIGI